MAEVVPLRLVAPVALQEPQLLQGLDALCHHPEPEAAGHADHGRDNAGLLPTTWAEVPGSMPATITVNRATGTARGMRFRILMS
jgi:hypothetical protein